MKFSSAAILSIALTSFTNNSNAFSFTGTRINQIGSGIHRTKNAKFMTMDMDGIPPPVEEVVTQPVSDLPVIVSSRGAPADVRYSDFLKLVNADRVEKVTFSADGTKLLGVDTDGTRLQIASLPNDPDLLNTLTKHKVDVTVLPANDASNGLGDLAQSLILPAVLFGGLFFLSRRGGGGGNTPAGMGGMGGGFGGMGMGGPGGIGKAKSKFNMIPDTGVNFDDVAGCDGAKAELVEIVDFLKQPEAYTKMGCRIPRGVILDGPPGTGKTLLAKAVAGEAGVPFLSVAGSEFVEMFVGVGASRVRDIYTQAKKNAPCIIFIDEVDAVARQRSSGGMGGNDEREQTINQILVEMDGFEGNPGIITMAATNRLDVIDKAMLRPGRFDRKITVDLPDFFGRKRILSVHARGKPLDPDVDLEAIARRTPGYSGAQLENLMNEAAIAAARKSKSTIGWEMIDGAVDRMMVGLERKGGTEGQPIKMKELVAYHEAGHAITGALVPDYDQVQKITIIPRSNGAGGLTFFAPNDSRLQSGMYSKQYLQSQLCVALGGRLAEELIGGEGGVTTGASNDIQQVANIAKNMVKAWGMGEVGNIFLATGGRGPMGLGGSMWGNKLEYAAEVEIERMVNNSYLLARKILDDNRALLDHLAQTLCDQEVVSAEEFQMMLVQFNAKCQPYEVIGPDMNRESLPFQENTLAKLS